MATLSSSILTSRPVQALALAALTIFLLAVVYSPGLSGPYTLDDNSSLLWNKQVQVTELNAKSLHDAAYSVPSGPTSRPISMISFAINYYFAGSFDDSTPFKITNLAIHILNALLVFLFIFLAIRQLTGDARVSANSELFFAAMVALIWAAHPIQLTSILYVIQRMSALSGTFVLLALVIYLLGRERLIAGHKSGFLLAFALSPSLALIGTFAKESAALFPLYVLALEATLFRNSRPWLFWHGLQNKSKHLLVAVSALVAVAIMFWFISYSLPGYKTRPFSLLERLLTEGRVITYYIFLILVPRLNEFGLHHDDIAISHSPFTPWTTIPSFSFLVGLLIIAFYYRKSLPVFSLGIFIFFCAHALESTVYPLDIAYEHRNYFASLGLILAAAELIRIMGRKFSRNLVLMVSIAVVLLTSTVTYVRAAQWRNDRVFYRYEALHHPDSAIANFELAGFLESYGQHQQAIAACRKAISLNPDRAAFRILLELLLSRNNLPGDYNNSQAITRLMRTGDVQPTTFLLLRKVMDCAYSDCSSILPEAELWLSALVEQRKSGFRAHEYQHMLGTVKFALGKKKEAEQHLLDAIRIKPKYKTAYVDLALVYRSMGMLLKAKGIYNKLLKIDPRNAAEYRRQISELSK